MRRQVEAGYRYAASEGLKKIRVFEEQFSGVTLNRPGLQQLRNMINQREISMVIVCRVDRLTRSPVHEESCVMKLGHMAWNCT